MNAPADVELRITEIQRFCMHDGPGLRTTVFLKGCPLRCAWCHNPETQKSAFELLYYAKKCIGCGACLACPNEAHSFGDLHEIDRGKCAVCGACAAACPTGALEIAGKSLKIPDIVAEIKKDAAFYGEKGGVTVSGGEPFAQPEGLISLLEACKKEGIGCAADTCGCFDPSYLLRAVPLCDIFLWDIKDTDPQRHRRYTGAELSPILDNLYHADSLGARIRLRCVLVNGVNTDEAHYRRVNEIALSLHNCDGIDVLPYHAYAGAKATFLGLPDNGRPEWIPGDDTVARANEIMKSGLF